ncbi:MAG: D-tyrosyl-tRNA(Tyr) deacylase [Chloroflexi bacterium]|nr:D-tyrosyl-tRNA(Tyr) deacylase [Chloroflexota bacterium]
MRAVLQRVTAAEVRADAALVARIKRGLLAYVGVAVQDGVPDVAWLARKIAELRLFPDPHPLPLTQGERGVEYSEGARSMERSVVDAGGAVLLVSQFTLLADTRRGRRPSFTEAAPPAQATALLDTLASTLRARGIEVATGRFGAHMRVEAVNDGPVTIVLDSAAR